MQHSISSKEAGILSPLVPGNVAGWLTLHETYGTIERPRLFRTAIGCADDGFSLTHLNSRMIGQNAGRMSMFPSASIILGDNDKTPAPGARLTMPQLAHSLRDIATNGMETFYRGELAEWKR